jgi:HTH-type transcriptional regulator, sugar sensing transcriptional regulator
VIWRVLTPIGGHVQIKAERNRLLETRSLSSRPISSSISETRDLSDKTRRSLQNLGLTDYEIKVYLALLDSPGSQASDISRLSEVPVSKIYEVLSNLERKGWVESQQTTRPARYFPKSPSTALQAYRMRLERELKSNEDYLLQELMPRYSRKEGQERPEIWIVRGEYNILAKVRESIERCKREILVVVPPPLNEVLDLIIPTLASIKEQGVTIRIMLSGHVNAQELEKMSSISELRIKDNMFGGGVICDAREVVILLGGSGGDDGERALAIWSDHEGLSSFAKNYFEFLWAAASAPARQSVS